MSRFLVKTGDILLFDAGGKSILSRLVKFFTRSRYSHVAMVLKDPVFINPNLKGYYIWESTWNGKRDPEDGRIKLGVQLTPFDEMYEAYKKTNSRIYVRRITCHWSIFNAKTLFKIHHAVHNKPYDLVPLDWFEALGVKDRCPQKTSRFWCSALVGYIYSQVGLLPPDTDWSVLRPCDFSTPLELLNGAFLSTETCIL